MRTTIMFSTLLSLSLGCRSENDVKANDGAVDATTGGDGEEEGEGEEEEDFSMYDGAELVILAPESGDYLPMDEDSEFEAVLFDADGQALPYDDIYWTSSIDMTWAQLGREFEDDGLEVGTHAITVTADLPNGDRLVYSVGGVLVQHPHAGIYTGAMNVGASIEYEGTPIGTSCIGGATIVVDAYGETATGESTCTIDLLGYAEFDLRHTFDFTVIDEELDGEATIALDIMGFDLPFSSQGEIQDGQIAANWLGSLLGFAEIDGNLNVERVTRSVELSD